MGSIAATIMVIHPACFLFLNLNQSISVYERRHESLDKTNVPMTTPLMHSNLSNIMPMGNHNAHDIKEVCNVNMDA